jgi:hypothetical protein
MIRLFWVAKNDIYHWVLTIRYCRLLDDDIGFVVTTPCLPVKQKGENEILPAKQKKCHQIIVV